MDLKRGLIILNKGKTILQNLKLKVDKGRSFAPEDDRRALGGVFKQRKMGQEVLSDAASPPDADAPA